ncbi:MAG TPA: hypothetical protein VJM83_03245, partial [Nitrospirota bacterium]|nr:hypothetical protein [Nitrospirota bacterium]
PVHMYGPSEEAELERVEHETSAALAGAARALKAEGVEVAEAMRSGYPDEEILRGMEEFTASMLIIPQAEDRPSELSKAASIINEESERLKRPVLMDVGGGLHPAKSI